MGGSSKQTIGYWFKYLLHYGWCRGPVDAVLEWRVGGRTAWAGRITGSTRIAVDQLNLFGGEKGEGGVQTDLDIMMGESDQAPNDYLAANMGPQQSGNRGKLGTVIRGGIMGAFNPYPKGSALKVERILKDWPDDTPWYPEKAPIPIYLSEETTPFSGTYADADGFAWKYQTFSNDTEGLSYVAADYDYSGWAAASGPFDSNPSSGVLITTGFGTGVVIRFQLPAGVTSFEASADFADDTLRVYVNGALQGSDSLGNPIIPLDASAFSSTSINEVALMLRDSGGGRCYLQNLAVTFSGVQPATATFYAMNPAHMLYESIIARPEDGGQGEPVGLINDASFIAAADTLYAEGFGLCTTWDGEETAEEFQDRICNIIGAKLNQSRADGQYYLDLIRDDYDFDALPIITEADILDITVEPTDIAEAVNQAQVGWFNPQAKENRVTPAVTSLGGVQAAGGVIPQTWIHREIPTEPLAIRVGTRYLAINKPGARYSVATNRRPWALRPGQYFRLQAPSEGIGDVVCLAGDIDYGEFTNVRMKIIALLNVFALPTAVFVDPEPGADPGIDDTPLPSPHQRAFELPYVELAASLSTDDLNVVSDEAGYLGTVATRPSGFPLNYTLMTAAGSEDYVDRGSGDWCPSATIVEAAAPLDTDFTLDDGTDLDQVAVGSWALWGDEIVRVDAIDATTGAATLGRGCADTVPVAHVAAERIYFAGEALGSDRREYVDGETVHAKLLTRTPGAVLQLADAADNVVTMDQRQARPYPPAQLRVDGLAYPAAVDGAFAVAWAHRNRELQADTLLDSEDSAVSRPSDVRYGLRFLRADTEAVLVSRTDLGSNSATVKLAYAGDVILELWSISDIGESWQRHRHTFAYTSPAGTSVIDGPEYVPTAITVVVDANDAPSDPTNGPDPDNGGNDSPVTAPTLTIGATVVDPVTYGAHPSASAATNSAAFNDAYAALPVGGGIVRPSVTGTYMVDPADPVLPVSNSRLDLATNDVRLQSEFSSTTTTPFLSRHMVIVSGAHDVEIKGGRITGYRDAWASNGGVSAFGKSEWAHGICVTNSTDVNIIDISIDKCVGDAVSVGRTASNVYIGNFKFANCRRQGISNGGDFTTIEDGDIGYIGGVDGTSPMAGIDNEVDNPDTNESTNQVVRRVRAHHCTGPGFMSYKNCNNGSYEDIISEYNSKGIYAVDSDNVTFSGTNQLRYNRFEGLNLRGTCATWDIVANFFANKTNQYGVPSGTTTTTSPTATQKAKHVTVESTVTGVSYDPATSYGPV